jgi:methylphosphotriester-DNA--protein-cysteine methyltransferase
MVPVKLAATARVASAAKSLPEVRERMRSVIREMGFMAYLHFHGWFS